MGALIVVDSPSLKKIIETGFKVNCKMTPQKIVELAKMDGAIILSSDLSKILYANVLLVPDVSINTSETGTRHKAGERTAKQAQTLVIAISERRKKISVYHGNMRYILQNKEELLSRATENLQILEKQREIFDELLSNLNVLEISGLVSVSDICAVLQRTEMINRTAKILERYLIELGKEGIIIRMRLRELLKNIDADKSLILRDYGADGEKKDILNGFSFDELLDLENIAKAIFSLSLDNKMQPKGYRILSKINFDKANLEKIMANFNYLESILDADESGLKKIIGEKAKDFQKEISSLKEQIIISRKI